MRESWRRALLSLEESTQCASTLMHTSFLTHAMPSSRPSQLPSIPLQALDYLIRTYEKELRNLNPGSAQLTYTVAGKLEPPHLLGIRFALL